MIKDTHRRIDVRSQQTLPLRKIFSLCVNGVKHRMLRSALTLAVVALAVAFFMFLQTETRLLQSVGRTAQTELDQLRFATRRLDRLTQNQRIPEQSDLLAAAHLRPDQVSLEERARITGWTPEGLRSLAAFAAEERNLLRFFENLPLGQRVILVGKRKGRAILNHLTQQAAWDVFVEKLDPLHDVNVPRGQEAFHDFLQTYPENFAKLQDYNRDWNEAVSGLRTALEALNPETPIAETLAAASPEQLERIRVIILEAGFDLTAAELARMQTQLRTRERLVAVSAELNRAEMIEKWRKTFLERSPPVLEEKLYRLDRKDVQAFLADSFSEAELMDVHHTYVRSRRLDAVLQSLAGRIDLEFTSGIAGRQVFLLLISLMVCMVGITNAMLMSISERFREIATMKCLGATDPFILRQFMLEAAIQGAAGGIIGMLTGFLIAVLKTLASFGGDTFLTFPVGGILFSALISFGCGVVLSILASIYPAWAASRMAPMEAMRIE